VTAARPDVQAVAKFVGVTPRKARLIADLIRNRPVPEARTILAFSTRAAARDIEKVLRSAVANAESNPNLNWNGDECFISKITIDEGPTIKRWKPRARGRVNRILKRTCHITIKVDKLQQVELKAKPATPAAEKPKRASSSAGAKSKRAPKKKAVNA
jgi:large subunit ribosomal protein L22